MLKLYARRLSVEADGGLYVVKNKVMFFTSPNINDYLNILYDARLDR